MRIGKTNWCLHIIVHVHLNIHIQRKLDLTSIMVSLTDVLASNAQIPSILPKHLVAIFAGATSGIGETTLKTLIKYAVEPRIYLFARNTTSAARVIAECRHINPGGEYIFIKVDLSSIKETDRACAEVTSRENQINLVVLSAGEARFDRGCMSSPWRSRPPHCPLLIRHSNTRRSQHLPRRINIHPRPHRPTPPAPSHRRRFFQLPRPRHRRCRRYERRRHRPVRPRRPQHPLDKAAIAAHQHAHARMGRARASSTRCELRA